jgi:hypothetical protein
MTAIVLQKENVPVNGRMAFLRQDGDRTFVSMLNTLNHYWMPLAAQDWGTYLSQTLDRIQSPRTAANDDHTFSALVDRSDQLGRSGHINP